MRAAAIKAKKKHKKAGAFDIAVYVFTALICAVIILPFLNILFLSLSNIEDIYFGRVNFFPKNLSVESYKLIFERSDVFRAYLNTIVQMVLGTVISLMFTLGLAYALSRKDLKGRKAMQFFCIFTMFFGGGMVPSFIVVQSLGMYNTIWALVLPGCVAAWYVIVVRVFINTTVPNELQEAARIDGAGNFLIFFKIVMPLLKVVVAIMILFYGVGYWNSYYAPLIYISGDNKALIPVQIIMRDILIKPEASVGGGEGALKSMMSAEAVKYSSIIITTLPILIAYPFFAKHLEKGMNLGGLKG